MRKIKVLHLITGLGKGGAERVVYDLCHLNNSIDLEQHVIGISEIDGMMAMFKADGIPVISLQMKRNPASFLHSFIRLNRILKQNNYDLIHTHMTHALIIAALLKLFAFPGKVIFTPHNSYFGRRLREWILFVLKPFRYTDILFSPQQKRYFHKKNYICIANGIVTENNKIKPPKFDVFTFLATGRLEKMKNHIALIEMANLLKKRNHQFQILIAGTGTLYDELEKSIQSNQLEGEIKLLGFRDDVETLCQKAHVFIMPSLWEGMPLAILEAGVNKLPVICTPVGSIPSFLNEKLAYLSAPGNFVDAMEETMVSYDQALKKADLFYDHIKANFSTDIMLDKHFELYKKVTQN